MKRLSLWLFLTTAGVATQVSACGGAEQAGASALSPMGAGNTVEASVGSSPPTADNSGSAEVSAVTSQPVVSMMDASDQDSLGMQDSSETGAPDVSENGRSPAPGAGGGGAGPSEQESSGVGGGSASGGAGGEPQEPRMVVAENEPAPIPADMDEPFMGTCTASELENTSAFGSGPYGVVVETNSDPGIMEGTIFRPDVLGGEEKFPIFVWGQGGCSRNGLSNSSAMAEIASHGYFVIADGTPNGSGNRTMERSDLDSMGAPLVAYVDWAVAENEKPCSAYYQSLDVSQIAANGFSCGGLMAQGTVNDPRIVTWGVTSSGMAGASQAFYDAIHTPVLFVEGGPEEVAYEGGLQGYEAISQLGVPVLWFSKDIGHGGDLFQADGGDFTRINLAWLNWWLKGDETESGKGALVGTSCGYCSDSAWEVMSVNVP